MYYSKSAHDTITIPKNYSGNTFRPIEEDDYIENTPDINGNNSCDNACDTCEHNTGKQESPSVFSGISIEDLLLLGLILVIHQDNPNDSTLILLLILLLTK